MKTLKIAMTVAIATMLLGSVAFANANADEMHKKHKKTTHHKKMATKKVAKMEPVATISTEECPTDGPKMVPVKMEGSMGSAHKGMKHHTTKKHHTMSKKHKKSMKAHKAMKTADAPAMDAPKTDGK